MMKRRAFLTSSAAALAWSAAPARAAHATPAFFDDLERRTFNFFWETANPDNGLVPDRWPTPGPSSIAAVGFGLSAVIIGAERGWISRDAAAERVLTTLRFFDKAPQGDAEEGVAGYKGFFYHFLDLETGSRIRRCELSSIDTAILHFGMLHAGAWFDAATPQDAEIRRLADDIVARADWRWFQLQSGAVSMGWGPQDGFLRSRWVGYNEGVMAVLLALGSRDHAVADGAWDVWLKPYPKFWRGSGANRRLAFAPLFVHQYPQVWIDFRGVKDKAMRTAGFDYFENTRRETYANRAYCVANPMGWAGYSENIWGLTACDGPGGARDAKGRRYHGYAARGPISEPSGFDDGTLTPCAALGSLAHAPEIVIPATREIHERYGARIYGEYGFFDAFNPSRNDPKIPAETGAIDPKFGWVGPDYLGIDQGPILAGLANYRDGSIWRTMRRSGVLRKGLTRAGFAGGWLTRG